MTTSNIFLGTTNQGKISFNFSSTNLSLGNNGTDVINIAANENIGIGFLNSLTPVYKLDVSGGNINTDSNYKIEGTDVLTSNTLGVGITSSSLESVGNLSALTVTGDLIVDINTLFVNSSNARIGINTTAPTVELDVNGSATISNNVLIEGDLTVNGTMTTFNTENVIIEDPLITLANNNTGDSIDSGVYSIYNDGTTKYAGYFRDATDGVYKFFEELEVEPTTTVDTGATGYTEASILVNTVTASNMTVTNTVSITNDLSVDTDTLYVNATNNTVGIGITNPTESLEVFGNIGVSGNIVPKLGDIFDLGTTGVRFRDLYLSGNTIHLDAAQISSNDSGTISLNAGLIVDTNTLSVDASTNNIGIGITNPSEKLDVIGNINASTGSSFKINNTDVITSTGLGSAVVSSSLTSVGTLTLLDVTGNLIVDTNTLSVNASSNNIGIGITNPSEKLDVIGNINASTGSSFKINNTDVITSTGLGSGVVSSSLTSVGTLTSLDVTGIINSLDTIQINNIDVITENSIGIGITASSLQTVANLTSLDIIGDLIVDINTFLVDTSSNSVGIGITNPSTYLNIGVSNISSSSQFLIQNDSIDASAGLSLNAGNFDFNILLDGTIQNVTIENNNGDIDIKAKDTGEINFYTTDLDDNRLTILNNGNIGISNIAPSFKLDVNGDLNYTGDLRKNGIVVSAGQWAVEGNDIYNVNTNNVGIGTTSPAQLLHMVKDIIGDTRLLIENNEGTNANTSGVDFAVDSTIEKVTGSIKCVKNGTNDFSLVLSTYDGTLTDQMTIQKNGNTTISGSISGTIITATTGNITSTSGDIIATDGDVKADTVTGEVYTGVCSTIGTLGYILLDEQSVTDMTNANFDLTLNLDNQSTDEFALYKLFIHGALDGDGTDYTIEARFIDTVGTISTTNGYYRCLNAFNGTNLINNTGTKMKLGYWGAATTERYYDANYTIHLSTDVKFCRMSGQITSARGDGTSIACTNIGNGMTTNASITTRITGITFAYESINDGFANPLHARIYRLL